MADDFNAAMSNMFAQANNLASNISVNAQSRNGRKLAKYLNNQNQKFAREQRDWNYKVWKEGLEYDTPAAQYQRYLDAGLNPAMMMQDSGPVAAGSSLPESPDLANQNSQGYSPADYKMDFSDSSVAWQNYMNNKFKALEMYRYEDMIDAKIQTEVHAGRLKKNEARIAQENIDKAAAEAELAKKSNKAFDVDKFLQQRKELWQGTVSKNQAEEFLHKATKARNEARLSDMIMEAVNASQGAFTTTLDAINFWSGLYSDICHGALNAFERGYSTVKRFFGSSWTNE